MWQYWMLAAFLLDYLLNNSKVKYPHEEKGQGKREPRAGCEVSSNIYHHFLYFMVLS